MRHSLLLISIVLSLKSFSQSQNLRDYIFPEGIRKTTFNYTSADGSKDENARMIFEYLVAPEGATVFVSNFHDNTVLSRKKEEYYISDTAIFLVNVNTENILSYKQENFFGYKNCFLKLPIKGKVTSWTYKEMNGTSYLCSATFSTFTVSNIQYSAIKVDKIPFEDGRYLDRFKTSQYYVQGKGLYKEVPVSAKKALYVLNSSEFDVSNSLENKETKNDLNTEDTKIQLSKVEIGAEFPGGSNKYYAFLNKNLLMPKAAEENSVNGSVIVSFVVKEDGSIDNIKVEESLGFGCDEEAVRLVKLFPKWKPAMNYGKNVASIKRLPISFRNTAKDD